MVKDSIGRMREALTPGWEYRQDLRQDYSCYFIRPGSCPGCSKRLHPECSTKSVMKIKVWDYGDDAQADRTRPPPGRNIKRLWPFKTTDRWNDAREQCGLPRHPGTARRAGARGNGHWFVDGRVQHQLAGMTGARRGVKETAGTV
eukprot:gene45024-58518_t